MHVSRCHAVLSRHGANQKLISRLGLQYGTVIDHALKENVKQDEQSPAGLANKAQTTLKSALNNYEDLVGLKEVKAAQDKVLQAEKSLLECQENRRSKQLSMRDIQHKLKVINQELEKVKRGEEKYLDLLTREHEVIKQETTLVDDLKFIEESERGRFSSLSAALRESHEKERARAERTKYWSIMGSVFGAVMGVVGTSISNRLRFRELRNLVVQSNENNAEMRQTLADLSQAKEPTNSVRDTMREEIEFAGKLHLENRAILMDIRNQNDKLLSEHFEVTVLGVIVVAFATIFMFWRH